MIGSHKDRWGEERRGEERRGKEGRKEMRGKGRRGKRKGKESIATVMMWYKKTGLSNRKEEKMVQWLAGKLIDWLVYWPTNRPTDQDSEHPATTINASRRTYEFTNERTDGWMDGWMNRVGEREWKQKEEKEKNICCYSKESLPQLNLRKERQWYNN